MTTMRIDWLPEAANARLNLLGQHMQANLHTFRHGDAAAREESVQRMITGFFGVLLPTMFMLMPVFALLLKLVYLFKRRLYIEHLIVALHSHAFLFLSLMLGALVGMLASWAKPAAPWLATPLGGGQCGVVDLGTDLSADHAKASLSARLAHDDRQIPVHRLVLLTFALAIAGVLSIAY